MNINRNNYETFFLLYADNELSLMEKKVVDEFVFENSDLQGELTMLKNSILKPENIVFNCKESLLKSETECDLLNEKLILFLDNELSDTTRTEVALLIKTNPLINVAWHTLQQPKLLPDTDIVFANKQLLYRKESVVIRGWWRVAAAAILIGFGLWGVVANFPNRTIISPEVIVKLANKKQQDTGIKTINEKPALIAADQKNIATENAISEVKPTAKITQQLPEKEDGQQANIKDDLVANTIKEKKQTTVVSYADNKIKFDSNETVTANVPPVKQPSIVSVNENIEKQTKINEPQNITNVYAATTSFTDNTEANDNRILFIDEEKIKKTKLGGIFKKFKRVLERSTNIKTGEGNHIRFANLEFAIQ